MARLTEKNRELVEEGRRRQILRAASRVFARRGYAAATIEHIARTAGVAEGTIYNYFRGKEDLLIHIPRHLAGPVVDELAARLPEVRTSADAERVLVNLGLQMIDRLTANVRFVRVFLSTLPYLSQKARGEYARLMPLALVGILEAHLRQGMAAGIYRRDLEPAITARAIPAMFMFAVIMQEVMLDRRPALHKREAVVLETIRLFLHGVLARTVPTGTGDGNARTPSSGR